MFGYKIEAWNYNPFRIKEAEDHINKMATQGYELIDISEAWFPLACYKKVKETKKQYAVTVADMGTCSKDFIDLIEESGWEKVEHTRSSLIVFSSEKGKGREIFTDDESRVEHVYETMNNSAILKMNIACGIIAIPVIIYLAFKMIAIEHFFFFNLAVAFALLMTTLDNILGLIVLEKESKAYSDGSIYLRPKGLTHLHKFSSFMLAFVFALILVFQIYICMINKNYLGAGIMLLLPFTFTSGYLISVNKKLRALGIVIMFISVMILYMGGNYFNILF